MASGPTEHTSPNSLWQLVVAMVLDGSQDDGQGQHTGQVTEQQTLPVGTEVERTFAGSPVADQPHVCQDRSVSSGTGTEEALKVDMLNEDPPADVLEQLRDGMDSALSAVQTAHVQHVTQTPSLTPRMLARQRRRALQAQASQHTQHAQQLQQAIPDQPAPEQPEVTNVTSKPAVMVLASDKKSAAANRISHASIEEALAQWERIATATGSSIGLAGSNSTSDRDAAAPGTRQVPAMMLLKPLPSSGHGSMRAGRLGEEPALFKLLDPDIPEHAQQVYQELHAYTQLHTLQDQAVPRLLYAGKLANGLFVFVYQKLEGQLLSNLVQEHYMSIPVAEAAMRVLQQVHRAAPGLLYNMHDLGGISTVTGLATHGEATPTCMLVNLAHVTLNNSLEDQTKEQRDLHQQLYELMGIEHALSSGVAADVVPYDRVSNIKGSVAARAHADRMQGVRPAKGLAPPRACLPACTIGARGAVCHML